MTELHAVERNIFKRLLWWFFSHTSRTSYSFFFFTQLLVIISTQVSFYLEGQSSDFQICASLHLPNTGDRLPTTSKWLVLWSISLAGIKQSSKVKGRSRDFQSTVIQGKWRRNGVFCPPETTSFHPLLIQLIPSIVQRLAWSSPPTTQIWDGLPAVYRIGTFLYSRAQLSQQIGHFWNQIEHRLNKKIKVYPTIYNKYIIYENK